MTLLGEILATAASAALSALGTGGLFKFWLDRNLEAYRTELKATSDVQLEVQKTSLRRATDEYLQRAAALRAEHGIRLVALYARIVRVERALLDLFNIARIDDGTTEANRAHAVATAGNEMRDMFTENRLLLPQTTATKIQELDAYAAEIAFAWRGANELNPMPVSAPDRLARAWERLGDIELLRAEIEDDFRALLGVPAS